MNRAERRAQMRAHNRGVATEGHPYKNSPGMRDFGRGGPLWPPHALQLRVHIEELILHGFPLKTRHAVSEAAQAELTRLLTSSGPPEFVKNPVHSDRIDGGTFNVTPTSRPQAIGNLIANAVYGGRWR